MEELPFSQNYDKLYALNSGHSATTIRRRTKLQEDEKVKIMTNGKFLCYAQITTIKKLKIKEIDDIELLADVAPHADNREQAIDFISSFYKIPMTEESVVHLISLKRIPESQVVVTRRI